ncbi:transporter substrate-binding protein [Aureimonas fodinaquatilis]|uniref:Transporter substrate-binding protein n=1 Tax=Aureimonas fodinaquatilis TaxID=2565783 RepID=A0A5B0DT63_9HYPH|nr:transporter substrate-binding domain-containing protein [Aureimonas fodinaquatilis]KAA0969598.1 transporter substrate-binding protein [Aureimonas fodinaquatilis]
MTTKRYPIGILFSSTGSYGDVARTMRNGAILACEQINSSQEFDFRLEPIEANPGGDLTAYVPAVEAILARGARHIVGCYTSSSRKEVIPTLEKRDALLWYPAHYEGFESASNVIYTGAVANHHIVPMVDYLMQHVGNRGFCIGSNYIWAWESNRVLREELTGRGGCVVAEHYLPVGEVDMDRIIDAIFQTQPDFILNSLIGDSAYAFFRQFRSACQRRGIDQVSRFPVASCNLSEPELAAIGPGAIDGHLSSSVYFASISTSRNQSFVEDYNLAFSGEPCVSAEAEAAFIAVRLLAEALHRAGTDEIMHVRACASGQKIAAPQGDVWLDQETLHAFLTPRIGRSRMDGQFDILVEAAAPVAPDPYLVHSTPTLAPTSGRPVLRIVT